MLASTISRPRDRVILFMLSAALLLFAPTIHAADAPTEPDAASAESPQKPVDANQAVEASPEQPETIPLEEITVESQVTLQRIHDLKTEAQKTELVESIDEALPATSAQLTSIDFDLRSIAGTGRAGRRTRRLEDELVITSKRLADWQEKLVNQTRNIQGNLGNLNGIETLWQNTGQSIVEEEGTDALFQSIGAVLSATEVTRNETTALRDRVLSTQTNVSGEITRLARLRENLSEINAMSREQILRTDSPFIWQVGIMPHEDRNIGPRLHTQFGSDMESLAGLLQADPASIVLVFLIMFGTAGFLIVVRRRHQETLLNDPRTTSAANLLNHPLSAGIVIALVITPIIVPDPPLAFYRYVIFALLIPVGLLLRTTLQDQYKKPALIIISLYVLVRISSTLPEYSLAQRLLELIVAVLGALNAFRWIRLSIQNRKKGITTHHLDWYGSRISILIYVAAALFNIFGHVTLGNKLLTSLVSIMTLALILIAGTNAIREFLRISMVVGPLRHLSAVKYHYATIDHTIDRVLRFASYLCWLVVGLVVLGILGPTTEALKRILSTSANIGTMSVSLGSILLFILTIWIAVVLSRSIRFVLNSDILPRFDLPRGIPSTISMMLHYGIITLGLLIALAAAGIDLSQLSIVIGALGVGIGFGLQSLVNNFVSGLILIFERPIKVGDKITFGTNMGEVRSIGIRASNVRAFDGSEIIVPNGNLISNEVTNWTLSDQQRRMDVMVGVAYGNDPEVVLDLLSNVLGQFDAVLKDPEPFISFDGFGESSLDFTVRFWINDFSIGLRLKSKIAVAVYKALNEAGIEIPFPQRDLHLRSISEAPAKTLGGKASSEEPTPEPS